MTVPVAFDRNARYGAALVGVLFAAYLNIVTDFSAFIQAANYAGELGTDVPLVDLVEFLICLGLYVVSLSIFPASPGRRVGAVTLACVGLLLWAAIGIERGTGALNEPVLVLLILSDQGMITLLVALGGWLIVRGRRPLAFLVLLLALIPPVVSVTLNLLGTTSGLYGLVTTGTVVVLGVAGAWLAALIDRIPKRARSRRGDARRDLLPAEGPPGAREDQP